MIIFITGTRTGIGLELARHFLDRGHDVIGCSRRRSPLTHDRYRHFEVDVTDSASARSMFVAIRQQFGLLDVVINNAGTSNMNHFMTTPESVVRKIFDVNFFGALNCSRESTKLLLKSKENAPAILNVSTVAVPWAIEGQLAYSASKSAVEQMTRVMSKELASLGIRVNGIGLPPVRTALTRTLPTELVDKLVERQAIQRMCSVTDITGPVEFLISSQSAFVTGETLFLGGVN